MNTKSFESLPEKAEDHLQTIGVSKHLLVQAIQAGYYAYINSTSFHPKTTPGFSAWSETVATLRKELKARGEPVNNSV